MNLLSACLLGFLGSGFAGNGVPVKQKLAVDEVYSADAIVYNAADRNVYLFGYVMDDARGIDAMPQVNRPRILRINSETRRVEELPGTAFGAEPYTQGNHQKDKGTEPRWFVDRIHQRLMRIQGSKNQMLADLSSRIIEGPKPEEFFAYPRMPMYWYYVSIDPGLERMWIVATRPNGPENFVRDFKNGFSWEYGVGMVTTRDESGPRSWAVSDYVSMIVPDERDGSAWLYLSHEKGTLVHTDRFGNTRSTLPFVKFHGAALSIAMDVGRGLAWYLDDRRRLVKMSLEVGRHQLELQEEQVFGQNRRCFSADSNYTLNNLQLAPVFETGHLWLYCRTGVFELDSNGKLLTSVPLDPLLRTR